MGCEWWVAERRSGRPEKTSDRPLDRPVGTTKRRYDSSSSPAAPLRAASKRAPASAQFAMFQNAFT